MTPPKRPKMTLNHAGIPGEAMPTTKRIKPIIGIKHPHRIAGLHTSRIAVSQCNTSLSSKHPAIPSKAGGLQSNGNHQLPFILSLSKDERLGFVNMLLYQKICRRSMNALTGGGREGNTELIIGLTQLERMPSP